MTQAQTQKILIAEVARLRNSNAELLEVLEISLKAMDCEMMLQVSRGESVHVKIGTAMNSIRAAIAASKVGAV